MICVGNHSLIWDGDCASIQPRDFQIPDGTYTSLTFQNGCIVAVGQAPIPQYTPQQCCDSGSSTSNSQTGTTLSTGKSTGNLATISNGEVTVSPVWDNNGNISVTGYGTANKPWKPRIKVSKKQGNTLTDETDGLYAGVSFKTSNTVEVAGNGTKTNPYVFNVKGAEAKLASVNKTEIEGNGFTIDEFGRVKADKDLKLISNLEFEDGGVNAFTVLDRGKETAVVVDVNKLKGNPVVVGKGIKGAGTKENPFVVDMAYVISELRKNGFNPSTPS